jgi:hypothetical protein
MPDDPVDRDLRDDLDPYREIGRRGEPERERLEDVELVPTRRIEGDDDDGLATRSARERLVPMVLVGLVLLGSALLAAMFFLFRNPEKPRASAAPAAAAAGPGGGPTTAPALPVPLPPLNDSDAFARSIAATLSSNPDIARWLARTNLVRTVAAVVTNVADGESPRPHLEFLSPAVRFRARSGRGGLVADPEGFRAYDAFGDAVASVNAAAAASAYRSIEPLLDEAHRELGHPEGRFRGSLDRAIGALLAVPVVPEDTPLVPHATLMRYADPRIEALSPAQKQLLRTGPRNVRLVQEKLRELQAALGAPPPAGGPPPAH